MAVIPFRKQSPLTEICLITSIKKARWIVPKGIIDPGETCHETALKEAWEEAGLRGQIVGESLGTFQDFKWGRQLEVSVLTMEVTLCAADWLESDVRQRRWFPPEEASKMIGKAALRTFVAQVAGTISS